MRGPDYSAEPLFKMERAACPVFGIRMYTAYINGYLRGDDGAVEAVWMQRRAADKQFSGKLDNFAGGGLTSGLSVRELINGRICMHDHFRPYRLDLHHPQSAL